MSEGPVVESPTPPPPAKVLETLDHHGIQLAVVKGDGTVRWASPSLVRSRGGSLIGGSCHNHLWRRDADCKPCRIEEVLRTGIPHRAWIPEARPGCSGVRRLLLQLKISADEILEAVVDGGVPDGEQAYQVFRERLLSEGLRHVPAGVLLLDAAMHVVAANPAASLLLGRSEGELKGEPLQNLLPLGSYPAEGRALAALLAETAVLEERELVIAQGLERRVVRSSLAAVPGPDANLAAAVAIFTEVTRQKILTEALSRKVGELNLLRELGLVLGRTVRLDQVLRLILSAVVHPGGLGCSSAALFLVQEERNLLRGRLARRYLPPELLPRREDLGQELEALASGPSSATDRALEGMVRRFAVPLEHQDHPLVAALSGTLPVVLKPGGPAMNADPRLAVLADEAALLVAPLFNQGKRLGLVAGTLPPEELDLEEDRLVLAGMVASTAAGAIDRSRLHDELAGRLEDLREANSRLRNLQVQVLKAERMSALGELAAEIVHQIRNPLSVVGGFARRLSKTILPGDPRTEDVGILIEETGRMEGILERIRQEVKLARIPARGSADPGEAVRAAVARYREMAADRNVRLVSRVEGGLPPVQAHRDMLLEVLDNLLRNALEAAGERGLVSVRAQRLKEAVHIVVEDDGPGIGPDRLEKIFEPFFTTKAGGTGLGLALSKRLVEQSGGSLSADSRPGEGARFRIVLRPTAGGLPEEEKSDAAHPDRG